MTTTAARPVLEVLHEVAHHLADGWHVITDEYGHPTLTRGADDDRITAYSGGYQRPADRWNLHSTPSGDNHRQDPPGIGQTYTRPPATLAADITRRLLPRHEAALTQQRARCAAVAAANDRALAVATLAADRLHGSLGHDDQRPRYAHLTHDEPERLRTYTVRGHAGQLYVQVTTYGRDDRHSITITNASPHAIRAILAALPAT